VPDNGWQAYVTTLSAEQLIDLIRLYGELQPARLAEINRKAFRRASPGQSRLR